MVRQQYPNSLSPGQEWPSTRWLPLQGIRRVPSLCALGLAAVSALSTGCDGTMESPPAPSQILLEVVGATDWEAVSSGPGLAYYGLRNEEEPWVVHLLRIEMDRCEIGLRVLEAPLSRGPDSGRSRVSDLAAADSSVLAAVNGDFFTPEGLPVGTEVVMGEARRVRARPAIAWRPETPPWMGVPERFGDSVLGVGWEVPRQSGDAVTEVVSGFPLLLAAGSRVGDLEVSERPSFAQERHPRTAVGWDSDQNILWVVVVDGRQPEHSLGMTLPELASLMEALGVEDGLNLDGGGSSVMVVGGETVSSPSDADGERPVANALGVRWDPGLCRFQP